MKQNLRNRFLIIFLALFGAGLVFQSDPARAQETVSSDDIALAERYAPVLYFHPEELFRPQSVDVLLNTARLREQRSFWFDTNILPELSFSDLFDYDDERYFLDVWYGTEGESDYKNYSIHRIYYQTVLSPEAGGPPILAYARVVRDSSGRPSVIQYWLFYYYNDWFNKHEGDWELVQLMLGPDGSPEWLVYSQHHGGTRRAWDAAQIEDGTHPAVYVALGSHANYFWGDENYPNGQDIGSRRIEIMDRTGSFGRYIPDIAVLPDLQDLVDSPDSFPDMLWLLFRGHWGELAPQSDFGGPLGPAAKGQQWSQPHEWGLAQPLDTEVWYRNRLRVSAPGGAQVRLVAGGEALQVADTLDGLAILHQDLAEIAPVTAELDLPPGQPFDLVVSLPEKAAGRVVHYHFNAVPAGDSGRAALALAPGQEPRLSRGGIPDLVRPDSFAVEPATWDAPDVVWLIGILPASEVARGVSLSLAAGLLPTLVYVGLFYWSDRYEKEPGRLLAVAFLWGAVPTVLIAVVVRLFFDLPATSLGREAVEAIRTGFVSPFIEEALKGTILVVIARRYRRELDNVLDGIIYGAVVGFGFAMSGNMISNLFSFLTRGFSGLDALIFIQGLFYALDHAFYSAVFGAGLGLARMRRSRSERLQISLGAFLLSVVVHQVHELILRNAVGLSLFTVLATRVGIVLLVVVVGWSLRRQRQTLETELVDVLPGELFRRVIDPRTRAQAEWRTLLESGFRKWGAQRRFHQLCGEFAFKRLQARRFPEENEIAGEAARLRDEIEAAIKTTQNE